MLVDVFFNWKFPLASSSAKYILIPASYSHKHESGIDFLKEEKNIFQNVKHLIGRKTF